MHTSKDKGYIGLIALLLVAVIIMFWSVRVFTQETKRVDIPNDLQPQGTSTKATTTTELERYRKDIEAAREIQDLMNTKTPPIDITY